MFETLFTEFRGRLNTLPGLELTEKEFSKKPSSHWSSRWPLQISACSKNSALVEQKILREENGET